MIFIPYETAKVTEDGLYLYITVCNSITTTSLLEEGKINHVLAYELKNDCPLTGIHSTTESYTNAKCATYTIILSSIYIN